MPKNWSKYQVDCFRSVEETAENLCILAVAGSGKTTTIVELCNRIPVFSKTAFCAFNKSIALELRSRLPKHVQSATLHSMGFSTVRDSLGKAVHVCNEKTVELLKDFIGEETEQYKASAPIYAKIVSLAKNNMHIVPEKADWDTIIDEYGITLPESFSFSILNDLYALATNKDTKRKIYSKFFRKEILLPIIDFDDMLFFPTKYNWNSCKGLDALCVDEAQDLNPAQIAMLEMAAKNGTRIIAVADENQAIFGFRSANTKSMASFLEKFSMKTLPLSVTYRCSKKVVEYAKRYVPEIEARENAPEGMVQEINISELKVENFRNGDLIVCRTNAPLVSMAYALLKLNNGIKFRIQGVELGQELGRLVGYLTFKNNLQDNDMNGFFKALSVYESHMSERYLSLKNGEKYLMELHDKLEVITIVAENCKSISAICLGLCALFADSTDRNCVLLSSIHRAKGLEVVEEDNTCYVLRTDLLPHPKATKDWELVQEANLIYVAYTRAKSNLVLIHKSTEK